MTTQPFSEEAHERALQAERIAAELAALGEEPADDEELALVSAASVTADDDVRTVATLVALSSWVAPAQGLLPLERHRIWQRIAARGLASPTAHPIAPAAEHASQGSHEASNGAAGYRGVLASLALVASVALLLRVDVAPPPSAEDRAALTSMGEATRAVLEGTLPGEQDGPRARALAEGYAERLQATRGAER